MKNFNPGDVIKVNLDPTLGHEQKGIRPAIVINHLYWVGLIIVVPLTTKDKGWWTLVRIPKDEGGVIEESFALCHQIRSLSEDRIIELLGRISSLTLSKIKIVLIRMLRL